MPSMRGGRWCKGREMVDEKQTKGKIELEFFKELSASC